MKSECIIIDVGDTDDILKLIGKLKLKGILLTHVHYDHIYGLNEIHQVYPYVPVFTNLKGFEALHDPYKNLSFYQDSSFIFEDDKCVKLVNDDDVFSLGKNIEVKTIFTPGHHTSCITWEIGKYMFTGDSYIPGVKTVTRLLDGCLGDAILSEEKIMNQSRGMIICPGHYVSYKDK